MRNNCWWLIGALAVLAALAYVSPLAPRPVTQIAPPPIGSLGHGPVLLAPLDSRPPCNHLVQKLAAIAGIEIIVPPNRHLDNYKSPANKEAVRQWTYNNASRAQAALLSSDLLTYGGLIASRQQQVIDKAEVSRTIDLLDKLHAKYPDRPLYLFSIIPRLLIAEDDETKLWQEPMRQWATFKDVYDTFEHPDDFKRLEKVRRMLPEKVIAQYENLYRENADRNHRLLELAKQQTLHYLVLGQDDAQPFGLPNRNRNLFRDIIDQDGLSAVASTTRGADEIAMLLLARWYNERTGFAPKVFVEYSDRSVPETIMPFMSASTAESAREKIQLIGGEPVDEPESADFILFVHSGSRAVSARRLDLAAGKIAGYLAAGRQVALVDLSQEYRAHQALLPSLLNSNAPLGQLAAYAGWNTTSNSLGTAVSQASLLLARERLAQTPDERLAVRTKNLAFTLERILDDWAYQKKIQKELDDDLIARGKNPYQLGAERAPAAAFVQRRLREESLLLQKNLRRHPFYRQQTDQGSQSYTVRAFEFDCRFPWNRTFEIDLTVRPTVIVASAE